MVWIALSVPTMVFAVAVAVLPVLLGSIREHKVEQGLRGRASDAPRPAHEAEATAQAAVLVVADGALDGPNAQPTSRAAA
jgi:hypothetical protein